VYPYDESLDDVLRAREERRDHLQSRIRGWLRKDRAPRLTTVLLLVPTSGWVTIADYLLRHIGLELAPLRWTLAMLAAWPVFVLLLRWRASAEWQCLHLDRIGFDYIRHDEGAEAALAAPDARPRSKHREAIDRGISEGLGRACGQGGLPVALILTALTLGGWTMWQLIQHGPTLLADTIINGEAVPASPALAIRISREHWFPGALGETGPYFLLLAFAAFLLGISVPFFSFPAAH
jgi:hypothetical protein